MRAGGWLWAVHGSARSKTIARSLASEASLGLTCLAARLTATVFRALARRLAEEGPEASRLRAVLRLSIAGEPPKTGGILAALRRSPHFDPKRPREALRSRSPSNCETRRGGIEC